MVKNKFGIAKRQSTREIKKPLPIVLKTKSFDEPHRKTVQKSYFAVALIVKKANVNLILFKFRSYRLGRAD